LLFAVVLFAVAHRSLLPVELQESVFSLCWAATRTEISELAQAKSQFMLKFKEVRTQFGTPLQVGISHQSVIRA
jgi:hypothetical protein